MLLGFLPRKVVLSGCVVIKQNPVMALSRSTAGHCFLKCYVLLSMAWLERGGGGGSDLETTLILQNVFQTLT